jgi:hypothetical protein
MLNLLCGAVGLRKKDMTIILVFLLIMLAEEICCFSAQKGFSSALRLQSSGKTLNTTTTATVNINYISPF